MPEITRRQALSMLAVTVAGGALLPRAAFAQDTLMDADVCVIVPEVTEGPYYFDPALLRADITEGRPGLPMTLKMQVVDQACAPLADARVDVWHCDADGNYSGYNGFEGETFMRGTQMSGRRRHGDLHHRLSRLVPRPDDPHPLQGLPQRDHRADRPDLLPRRGLGAGLRDRRALHRAHRPRHLQRRGRDRPAGRRGVGRKHRADAGGLRRGADRWRRSARGIDGPDGLSGWSRWSRRPSNASASPTDCPTPRAASRTGC